MKNIIIFILALISVYSFGQKVKTSEEWYNDFISNYGLENKESKSEFIKYDFSKLFLKTPSTMIYGIIGDSMQRFQIKWISINQDSNNPESYYVFGKTKVKSNVCEFTGSINLKTIRLYQAGKYDMPTNIKLQPEKIGVLFCDYTLIENMKEKHTGILKGISAMDFYLYNDTLYYNDLRSGADDMTNNQFVGTCTDYYGGNLKICNWGEYRVPNVSGFDCGVAEFLPCEKYAGNGWIVFIIAHGASPDRMHKEDAKKSRK
jgi:hypothetical protein